MQNQQSTNVRGWTLIEVLIVITVLLVLAAMFLPALAKRHARSSKIGCTNALKQIGLAYRIWAGDNSDLYPMQVSTNSGGSMEFVGQADQTFQHFAVMSNELNTPKLLVCPYDSERVAATLFGPASPSHSIAAYFTGNSNVSYFVGVDASETNPAAFLSGDRNITNGQRIVNGILALTTNELAGWTDSIHSRQGNVGLADGSVQGFSSSALRRAIAESGVSTNRLAMP